MLPSLPLLLRRGPYFALVLLSEPMTGEPIQTACCNFERLVSISIAPMQTMKQLRHSVCSSHGFGGTPSPLLGVPLRLLSLSLSMITSSTTSVFVVPVSEGAGAAPSSLSEKLPLVLATLLLLRLETTPGNIFGSILSNTMLPLRTGGF
jgi:hypothetical protein